MKHLASCASTSPKSYYYVLKDFENTKELWEKLKSLFRNEDELRGHILENDMIALHPNRLKTIQQIFSKFKFLSMQFKQCGIDKNDEQLVLSIMRKLAQNY